MHADRPQAVSLFFSKVSEREKERGRGRRRRRRGERKKGGREEVLGGDLHLLQEYFFFNSFRIEIMKSHKREEKNFDQERKKFCETLYSSFYTVLIWHMAQSACMHLVYINKY